VYGVRLDEPGWWYGSGRREELVARILAPLGELYGSVLQSRFKGHVPYASRLPVICIGNFTAGGTGKTPLALFVTDYLASLGESPVCLTRGYGGTASGPIWVASGSSTARQVGDEPLLLARAGPTLVARDRKAGAQLIEEGSVPASVIVMDDGMQNPELKKNLVLAVVDGKRGLGNGRVIPAGPLRAPLEFQAGLVDCVVVNGVDGENAGAEGSVLDRLKRSFPGPVLEARVAPVGEFEWLRSSPVVAYAGIGNPDRFFELLKTLGAEIIARKAFPDHHAFSQADAAALLAEAWSSGAQLVTTEKDMARLGGATGKCAELLAVSRALPIRLKLEERDLMRLKSLIDATLKAKGQGKAADQR
jgi:tetraacyldisaccharide 4'-kinase